jgi:hypothetical protein
MPNANIAGTTIAAIRAAAGSPIADGQSATLLIGPGVGTAGADQTAVNLTYNAALDKFLSEEFCAIRSTDQTPVALTASFTTKQYIGPATGNFWGVTSMRNVGSALAAGLALQYRHGAFLQLSGAGKNINLGCPFYQFNSGDPSPPASGYNTPPNQSDLVAETAYLQGGAANPGFKWTETGWANLLGPAVTGGLNPSGAPAITKDFLYPRVHAVMDAGAISSGSFVDYQLFLRYAG